MLQLLDVVALLVDHPEVKLSSGQVGTVVHVHNDDTFEVEFADDNGITYALVDLKAEELLKLRYEAEAAA